MSQPELTVVVAPIGDGSALPGCLEALRRQERPPHLEVIVPVDGSIRARDGLRRSFPEVRFLETADTTELALSGSIGVAHLAIDRRRSAALAAASGRVIALTEEQGRPDPTWARNVVDAHAALPNAVIGGAVVNVNPRVVNWSLFFMDGGRYQNPVPEEPVEYVTDVNVTYKREALSAVREVWSEVYDEAAVHAALAARGERHVLRRDIVMGIDRGRVPLRFALAERFAWARLYAARRSRRISTARRLALAVTAPLIAALFLARQTRLAFSRGQHRGPFLRCLPLLLVMDLVWSVGEMTGYITGREVATRR